MALILDKSSGVDTDLSRSFTNISQTVGVNLHTVEDKISFGSIYECPTTLMSWLLFIQFFDHETSPSSFVFLCMSSLFFFENSGAEIQIKYETVGVNLHTVENKISLNSIYECLTILMSCLLFVQFLIMKCLRLLLYCSTSSLTFFVNFGAEIQIKCETVGVNLRTVKKANFS
jgi:hypothetical protein